MRQESSPILIFWTKLLWATLLAFILQTLLVVATFNDETANSMGEYDDNLELPKRIWNKDFNTWGKRSWNTVHGGWGVKRSEPSWLEQNVYSAPPIVQKRDWKNFERSWGKRLAPNNEDLRMHDIDSLFGQDNHQSIPLELNSFAHDEEKRAWKLSNGWGKRNKFGNIQDGWDKRQPAWANSKGLWGKRSEFDNNNSYK